MPEVDPTMGEPEKPPSRIEQIKYYTSLFLGALAIVCVFGFLFLVPFVLDPAISTMMHQFVTDPVHCKVTDYNLRYGKSNCTWASCKEGCTAEIFKCHQIRVTYTPKIPYKEEKSVDDFVESDWAYLTRMEKETVVDTFTGEEEVKQTFVEDTPLLINIKGCGYPPTIICDDYAEQYNNYSIDGLTFPCYYSKMNPWIVLSKYNEDEEVTNIAYSLLIPNLLFILSLVVLVYWYCPYCQARCKKYEQADMDMDSDDEDGGGR